MLAMLAAVLMSAGDLPAPLPPPPFSIRAARAAGALEASVSLEFKRCGYVRTYSNGRYVEALGTARHSTGWKIATRAMNQALITCRGLRGALRIQKDYLLATIQSGSRQDIRAASFRLESVLNELSALEAYFGAETVRYRGLIASGWGDPHCVSGTLERLSPPESICPKTSDATMK